MQLASMTVHFGPRSVAAAGPSTWNTLPVGLWNQQLAAVSSEDYCFAERRAYSILSAHSWLSPTVRVGEH